MDGSSYGWCDGISSCSTLHGNGLDGSCGSLKSRMDMLSMDNGSTLALSVNWCHDDLVDGLDDGLMDNGEEDNCDCSFNGILDSLSMNLHD